MAAFIVFCLFVLSIYAGYVLNPSLSLILLVLNAVIALHVIHVSRRL